MTFPALMVAVGFAAAIVVGCSRTGTGAIKVSLDNMTDTPVGLYVNDDWVGTYPAGASVRDGLGDHGGPPYAIEVRSGSGQVLAAARVNEAQATSLTGGGPAVALEQGLPCGVIRLIIGELPPDAAPAPAESVPPGPCP